MKRPAIEDDDRVSPNKCAVVTNNAFSVLMRGGGSSSSGNKRKNNSTRRMVSSKKGPSVTSNTGSRFVPCPAGCGRHFLPHEMNAHLDKCIVPAEHFKDPSPQSRPSAENVAGNRSLDDPAAELTPERTRKGYEEPNQNDETETNEAQPGQGKNDIFSHMMKRATEIFAGGGSCTSPSSTGVHKLVQGMHLHTDGSVSLTCYGSRPNDDLTLRGQPEPIAWAATVDVKRDQQVPVELIVSSSIPPAVDASPVEHLSAKRRLVQRHSRLSVPVLKSILQKSIRRRKPLPSVRVAMELADKSMGDLLRRLPIIVVEDSTLHSGVPLLVWLMIASSKDYDVPLSLMKRILQIVFEVASCRWKDDHVPKNATSVSMVPIEMVPAEATIHGALLPPSSISCLHKVSTTGADHSLSSVDILLWSLLMRSHYGGMAGDVRMLREYAETWHIRFHVEKRVPEDMVKRLTLASNNEPNLDEVSTMEWSQVPTYIHQVAAVQSPFKIDTMVLSSPSQFRHHQHESASGLPCLFATDLTSEGVDFHCSSVLETAVLSDIDFLYECYDQLERMTLPSSVTPIPTAEETTSSESMVRDLLVRRRSWLGSLLKSLMWNHSAGVNLRLPLVPQDHKAGTSPVSTDVQAQSSLKHFWETKIRPRTKAFSERYVQERLARG